MISTDEEIICVDMPTKKFKVKSFEPTVKGFGKHKSPVKVIFVYQSSVNAKRHDYEIDDEEKEAAHDFFTSDKFNDLSERITNKKS